MKTTVQIPDGLLAEARKLAERDGTTLEALVEEGLRRVINERSQGTRYRLRKAHFKGNGLQAHLSEASWEHLRELGYEGRSG
jgi:hypothetical protein